MKSSSCNRPSARKHMNLDDETISSGKPVRSSMQWGHQTRRVYVGEFSLVIYPGRNGQNHSRGGLGFMNLETSAIFFSFLVSEFWPLGSAPQILRCFFLVESWGEGTWSLLSTPLATLLRFVHPIWYIIHPYGLWSNDTHTRWWLLLQWLKLWLSSLFADLLPSQKYYCLSLGTFCPLP